MKLYGFGGGWVGFVLIGCYAPTVPQHPKSSLKPVCEQPSHPLTTTSLHSSPVPAPALNPTQLTEAFFRHSLANGCHVSATPDREVRVDKDGRRSLCVVVDSVCHAAALADHLEGWRVLSAVGERFPRNSRGPRWTYDRCVLTTRRLEEAINREGTTDRIGCDVVVWAGGGPAIPEAVQRLVTDAPGRLLVDVLDGFNTSVADESLGRIKALRSAKWTVTEASTLPTADKMSVVRR